MKNKNYKWTVGIFLFQLILISVFYRNHWKLLIFVSVFFIISLLIKSNLCAWIIIFSSFFFIFIPTLYYRIPILNTKHRIESKIIYQMIDFGQGDMNRCLFESILDNRRFFIVDENTHWLYIDNKYKKLLWPESPWEMKKKNYTVKARFTFSDLMLGGYTIATVDSVWTINELPTISK
ncbi:MAG: hypothetical protein R2831_08465 [Chitinophagaceae bacterium]